MESAQRQAARLVAGVLGGRSLDESPFRGDREGGTDNVGLLRDITYGTLRRLGEFRQLAHLLAHRGIGDPLLEALLYVALYQLGHTKAPPHAIVNHAVGAARSLGLDRSAAFLNAILRRALREHDTLLAQVRRTPEGRWSHPDWWIDKLNDQYGPAAAAILEAGLMHPPMTLRPNRRRCTVDAYRAMLTEAGMAATDVDPGALTLEQPVPVRKLPGFDEGLVSVQDAGAQWAARLLDVVDGQRVLDACAAPGGKTCHILERADADLTALDVDPTRIETVRTQLTRLGLTARTRCADAADVASWWDGRTFDRVLLDAPCSASGIVRRHPDARWLRRPGDLAGFARQQRRLLGALWQVLAPGGKLLYVTCSVFREENAAVVDAFLRDREDAQPLPLTSFPAPDGQLRPTRLHDGFFYALLAKR